MEETKKMLPETIRRITHWIALSIVVYIFGYAGIYKIIGVPSMIDNMTQIGFGKIPTLLIGIAEVAGVTGILVGLFYRPVKNISLIALLPFAIGAFTIHMSYQHPFPIYLNSLLVCVMPLVILWTDKEFSISI